MLFKIHEWYDKIKADWIRMAILGLVIFALIIIPWLWLSLPLAILFLIWRVHYLVKKPKGELGML